MDYTWMAYYCSGNRLKPYLFSQLRLVLRPIPVWFELASIISRPVSWFRIGWYIRLDTADGVHPSEPSRTPPVADPIAVTYPVRKCIETRHT